jgi:acyl carrier protein
VNWQNRLKRPSENPKGRGNSMSNVDSLVSWLQGNGFDPEKHGPDYQLIENRIIDSMKFTELLLLLEHLLGRQIQMDEITLDKISTLNSLTANFFQNDLQQHDDTEEFSI